MTESNFLPVRPNINGDSTQSHKDKSIFANNKDADIQQFINNKKMNALSIDSPKTKEEILVSRKEQKKFTEVPKNESDNNDSKDKTDGKTPVGVSWVIIGLAVVILILILIIVYYVINHNNITSHAPIIPESVMKPTPVKSQTPNTEITNVMENETSVKPLVKPPAVTKNELDSVLNRLQTIEEVDESDEVDTPDEQSKMETNMDNIIESKFEELSKISYNDNEMDEEIIEDFKLQAMSQD